MAANDDEAGKAGAVGLKAPPVPQTGDIEMPLSTRFDRPSLFSPPLLYAEALTVLAYLYGSPLGDNIRQAVTTAVEPFFAPPLNSTIANLRIKSRPLRIKRK